MPPLGGARPPTVSIAFVAPAASEEVEVVEEIDIVGVGAGGAGGDVVIVWIPTAPSTGELGLLL